MRTAIELVGGVILASLIWGTLGSARIVRQVRYHSPLRPSDFDLPAQAVTVKTADGIRLHAWLIVHPKPIGVVLMLHGYGASKEDLLDLAHALHGEGAFHLLLVDLRGHGSSEGNTISFGHKEMHDIQALLEWTSSHPITQGLPIGCFGLSMGGAIALLAAARFPSIQAVVVDSAYADLPRTMARMQWLTYHIPRLPLGQLAIWGTEVRLRCRLDALSPIRVIDRISPRPVLIIHGKEDATIPKEDAIALYHKAKDPKALWLLDGAGHVAAFYQDPFEYSRRVAECFRSGFARSA